MLLRDDMSSVVRRGDIACCGRFGRKAQLTAYAVGISTHSVDEIP